MNTEKDWTVYRTRFLVRARQLTEPLTFTDALGRQHTGAPGDYLVESSQGCLRITKREIFEDVYVALHAPPGPEVAITPRASAPGICDRSSSTAFSLRKIADPVLQANAGSLWKF